MNREIEALFKIKQKKLCEVHEKPLEYYCMTDLREICQVCIIFGKHKDHKYTFKQDLNKVNQAKINGLKQGLGEFLFLEEFENFESLSSMGKKKAQETLDREKQKMMSQYNVS